MLFTELYKEAIFYLPPYPSLCYCLTLNRMIPSGLWKVTTELSLFRLSADGGNEKKMGSNLKK